MGNNWIKYRPDEKNVNHVDLDPVQTSENSNHPKIGTAEPKAQQSLIWAFV